MSKGGPNVSHPTDGMVWACGECDSASQLYQREDKSVKCHDCGAEFKDRRYLTERESHRGSNLTPELNAKGGRRHSPPGDEASERGKLGGRPPKGISD